MAEGNGTARVGLWLSIGASGLVVLGIIGSMFYVAYSTKANTDALVIQAGLIQSLQFELNVMKLKQNTIEVTMGEIETQFCAQDIVRNLMHANDLRSTKMLWEKVYGSSFPTDNAYYPTICNRPVRR